MRRIIGIDFGTTNSLCAWLEGDRPSIIPNARGARCTPSVVARSAKGEILVGESAKNQALVNPDRTVSGVKRMLGSGGLLTLGDVRYRPEELAAFILGSLRRDVESYIGAEIRRAVISAPAHFTDTERKSLAEAGRIAGIEVQRIVNEPTAAAVARAWEARRSDDTRGGSILLVYDFGGGTFDVTVLKQEGALCTVLASRGDGHLGGTDIDRELRRIAASRFAEEGLDFESDRFLAQQLSEAVERAKIELSERRETSIALVFASSGGRVSHPSFELSREQFEEIAEPYVRRSIELTEKAISDSGLDAADIDALILSGGSSRMPIVRRMLERRFGLKIEGGINPEEIVALGAAAWASLVDDGRSGGGRLHIRDVVSRTYGVEAEGGVFIPLIRKNSPVPVVKSRTFTTVSDRQDSVEIHVLQGESPAASENISLGRFLLSGIRAAKAGEPRIRVDFEIDESDMLHVSARDLDTGAAQTVSIPSRGYDGAVDPPEVLEKKTAVLVQRLEELRMGLDLERGLQAELDDVVQRARSAQTGSKAPDLGMIRMELEALVGELLARRAEAREDPAALGTRRT
jgi:molecular chaperone DnaK